MNTILVPTDFSSTSQNGLDYAKALAIKSKAKITLFNAYHTIPQHPEIPSDSHWEEVKLLKADSDKRLKVLCEEVRQLPSQACSYVSSEGETTNAIIRYVDDFKPDFVVMGTQDLSAIDKAIFGTVTGKVIKGVTCPVIVVPEHAPALPPKKVVFAIDYNDSDIDDLRKLLKLTDQVGAELHMLRVVSAGSDLEFEDRWMEDLKVAIDDFHSKTNIVWNQSTGQNVQRTLTNYVTENDIDLLAASTSKHTFLERLFLGSVTQQLFRHTQIPLLVFHAVNTDLHFYKQLKREDVE